MLIGLIVGLMYAAFGFRGKGNPPRLACTCGPFRNGMLYCGDVHVHHWMIYAPLSLVAVLCGYWDLAAFCTVMTLQGLSYSDALEVYDEYDIENPQPLCEPDLDPCSFTLPEEPFDPPKKAES